MRRRYGILVDTAKSKVVTHNTPGSGRNDPRRENICHVWDFRDNQVLFQNLTLREAAEHVATWNADERQS